MLRNIISVTFAVLVLGSTPAFAGPTFESVTFGKQSTHCNAGSARATVVPDGSGISILFDKMQAQSGVKGREQLNVRCDVTLNLAAPLEAPATILMDVRGAIHISGYGTASATVALQGHKQALRFDAKGADGVQRLTINLPKGAKKLDMTFEASAQGKQPDSSALAAIDSLDIGFEWRK